jgi:hypothetical protein
MNDEKENGTDLVKREFKLSLRERLGGYAGRKQREFEEALEAGRVNDPLTSAIAIGIYISIATSAAGSPLTRTFPPKGSKC